jgi:hypothetical protein
VSIDDWTFAGVVIFNSVCAMLNAYFAQRNFESARENAELARSLADTLTKYGFARYRS